MYCKFKPCSDITGRFICSVCGTPSSRNKTYGLQGPPLRYCPHYRAQADMNNPCQFKRLDNGWWKCTNCNYTYKRPSSRAPVRLCKEPKQKPTLSSPRKDRAVKQRLKRNPPKRATPLTRKPLELGDVVHNALSLVGITPERVTAWMGRPCKCPERQQKLNDLSRWAKRVISGKTEKAKEFLEELIE